MSPDNVKKLQVEFPVLFSQPCSFWCDDGWLDLIHDLAAELTEIASREGQEILCAGVKEKFGGLRFYISGGNSDAVHAVREAERASYAICEVTGRPGTLCVNTNGGYRTLAPHVAEKLGYHPAPVVGDVEP